MADRIGIELTPFACRIVELQALQMGRPRLDAAPPSLTLLPRSGPATTEYLASLRGRTASVVLWGLHSDHRQVVVGDGSYDRIRAEARAAARAAGVPVHGTLSDVAPAGPVDPDSKRRVVVLATAPIGEVTAAIRPLVEAGIKIHSVRTPASALVSLARLRGGGRSGMLEAYIAIGEASTTVAIVQSGLIRFARDFTWGSRDEASQYLQEASADDLDARLTTDVGAFVEACGSDLATFDRVVLTGDVPDLRSIAIRMTGRFDVEVEPLDYAGGLELDGLAESIESRGGRFSDVWLAWAAAADDKPLIDLYRDRRFFFRKQIVARAAVAAGVVLGVGVGWTVAHRMSSSLDVFTGAARQSVPVAAIQPPAVSPAAEVVRPAVPAAPAPVAAPASVERPAVAPPASTPAPAPAAAAPVPEASPVPPPPVQSAVSSRPAPSALPPLPAPQPGPAAPTAPMVRQVPRAEPPPAAAVALVPPPRPSTAQPPPLPPPRAATPPPVSGSRPGPPAASPPVRLPSQDAALPFDAVLGTILHGPDRKLAVVDDRIVQVGDDVRGAVVIEITPNAVLLRDQQGRLRRLTLGSGR